MFESVPKQVARMFTVAGRLGATTRVQPRSTRKEAALIGGAVIARTPAMIGALSAIGPWTASLPVATAGVVISCVTLFRTYSIVTSAPGS